MALTLLSAKNFAFTLKVTIHKSGKLGFSAPTAEAVPNRFLQRQSIPTATTRPASRQ